MIFISYASEDFPEANAIADQLGRDGLSVWMDKRNILPGQDWEQMIWRAAFKADYFCVFLSHNSVAKRGFVRKEIRFALDKWKEKLPEDVYLIPCRLTACELPFELGHLQRVDLFKPSGYQDLLKALGWVHSPSASTTFFTTMKEEDHSGEVDVELEYPSFEGTDLAALNELIKTNFVAAVRDTGAQLQTELPSQSENLRSYVGLGFSVRLLSTRLASVLFTHDWYASGAAHPNYGFSSICFDRARQRELATHELFKSNDATLLVLSAAIRFELEKQRVLEEVDYTGEGLTEFDQWIAEGAGPKWDNFTVVVDAEGLEFVFAPYQVACYAAGAKTVHFRWEEITHLFNDDFRELIEAPTLFGAGRSIHKGTPL
ncbi:MAG: TIR domain-containing protein [Xanthobacteraceae bacterium]